MIQLQNLNIFLPGFNVRDINLTIETNEFFILMGPTGAGKTLLLEAIAGLLPVQRGKIITHHQEITALPPEKRGIGIVYQDQALFPHLTVLENVIYGLHFHPVDKQQKKIITNYLVDILNLSHLLQRLPENLSGGEKQRVALARALIVAPKVLLLDEPLSALDPQFREEIRNALKELHNSSDTTFLMVTHDFGEALSLADRAAVMNNGTIEQVDRIENIFQKPSSKFVAEFVGMKNVFSSRFSGSQAILENGIPIELSKQPHELHRFIAIRPEDIVMSKNSLDSSMRNSFQGKVTAITDCGFYYEIDVRVKDVSLKALITKRSFFDLNIRTENPVYIAFKATAIHTF